MKVLKSVSFNNVYGILALAAIIMKGKNLGRVYILFSFQKYLCKLIYSFKFTLIKIKENHSLRKIMFIKSITKENKFNRSRIHPNALYELTHSFSAALRFCRYKPNKDHV